MTSQWVERTWIRTGVYGRFRGEWVNVQHYFVLALGWWLICIQGWTTVIGVLSEEYVAI